MQEKLHKEKRKQKVQKFVPVFDENLSVKNAPEFSEKHLADRIFKIKIIQNISLTLRTFLTNPHMHKMGPCGPKHYIFAAAFAQKMPESSGFIYSSILLLGNIWHYHFTWSDPNSQKFWTFPNLIWVWGDPQFEQNSQFLVNSVHFR